MPIITMKNLCLLFLKPSWRSCMYIYKKDILSNKIIQLFFLNYHSYTILYDVFSMSFIYITEWKVIKLETNYLSALIVFILLKHYAHTYIGYAHTYIGWMYWFNLFLLYWWSQDFQDCHIIFFLIAHMHIGPLPELQLISDRNWCIFILPT